MATHHGGGKSLHGTGGLSKSCAGTATGCGLSETHKSKGPTGPFSIGALGSCFCFAKEAVGQRLQCCDRYQPKEAFEVVGKDAPITSKYAFIFSYSPTKVHYETRRDSI